MEPFIIEKSASSNLAIKWDVWMEDFDLIVIAAGIINGEQKKALLLHISGKEVKEVYRG